MDKELELEAIKLILMRENLLNALRKAVRKEELRNEFDGNWVVMLKEIRSVTCDLVETIQKWQSCFVKKSSFLFEGRDYMAYLNASLNFLDQISSLKNAIGFALAGNPFLSASSIQKRSTDAPTTGFSRVLQSKLSVFTSAATGDQQRTEDCEQTLIEILELCGKASRGCSWCGSCFSVRNMSKDEPLIRCSKCRKLFCKPCQMVNAGGDRGKTLWILKKPLCFRCDRIEQERLAAEESKYSKSITFGNNNNNTNTMKRRNGSSNAMKNKNTSSSSLIMTNNNSTSSTHHISNREKRGTSNLNLERRKEASTSLASSRKESVSSINKCASNTLPPIVKSTSSVTPMKNVAKGKPTQLKRNGLVTIVPLRKLKKELRQLDAQLLTSKVGSNDVVELEKKRLNIIRSIKRLSNADSL
eukprot:TRINITY_DN3095_c0_g1_i2.p1 TRINITY_DN3095_c0_g1~~TRINITY_DN3095_c0_g1_i2.p1  ORF type:complete len:415 (-),score=87.67 TRINITY_DN3095_c0_g1_i2:265-1509(-)